MNILAFSDLHHSRGCAEAIVGASIDAELLIGAGDFCNMRQELPAAMNLLAEIETAMIVVPGNAESETELVDAAHKGTTVLHGSDTNVGGLKIFGLGYGVPETPFGEWSCDLSEKTAAAMLAPCDYADILIVHSPPKGVADLTSAGQSVGSTAIRDAIERLQPKFALCGHIHDSWGRTGMIGQTKVINLGPRPNWIEC